MNSTAKYGVVRGNIAEIKYSRWDAEQRDRCHGYDLNYDWLSSHPFWIDEERRKGFAIRQWHEAWEPFQGSPPYHVRDVRGLPPGVTAIVKDDMLVFVGTSTVAGQFESRVTIVDSTGATSVKPFAFKADLAVYTINRPYTQVISSSPGNQITSYSCSAPLPRGLSITPAQMPTDVLLIGGLRLR